MNITWSIVNCEYRVSDGYIETAHWKVTAKHEHYLASNQSTCNFKNGTLVKAYDNITEQDVLDWCWSNGVDKQEIEKNLREKIELQKSPQILNGTPWQNVLDAI